MKHLINKIKDRSRYTVTKRNDYLFIFTDRVKFRFEIDQEEYPIKYSRKVRASAKLYSSPRCRTTPIICRVNKVPFLISAHYPSSIRIESRFGTKENMDTEIKEEFRKIILTFNIQFIGIRDAKT